MIFCPKVDIILAGGMRARRDMEVGKDLGGDRRIKLERDHWRIN